MRMNLKGKFLFPLLSVAVLGLALVTFISYSVSRDALEENIQTRMHHEVSTLADMINDWVVDHQRDIRILASQQHMAKAFTSDGMQDSSTDAVLKKMYATYGSYEFLALIDTEGKVVSSSDQENIGLDLHSRDYVKKALSGQSAISKVLRSKASSNPIFAIAEPVTLDERIVGVLAGVVDMQGFNNEFISTVQVGERGYAYLVDADGTFLSHPDRNNVLKEGIAKYEWGQKILKQKSGFIQYPWKGINKIVSYKPIEKTGWIIASGAELEDIFAPINKVRNISVYVSAGVVALMGLVIYLAVTSIVNAIRTGVAFAEKIRLGDVSTRLNDSRRDELGVLTRALDSMADSLEQKAELAERVAAGDISQEVELASDRDRLGLALQKMTSDLNDILHQVQVACDQIATGSAEVADSSQSLSQGATESASSLEEIAASMNQLTAQIKQNAEHASEAKGLSEKASRSAAEGNTHMHEMVGAMAQIDEAGQSISKIIKVIDEIAFQTNLLALNAAVEAARAGQHGKGFAVVAEEVRSLAARSAKAAQETADLIEGSVEKTRNGAQIADKTAESFEEIVAEINKVSALVGDIAAASDEQAQGISEINVGLGQIDQVTQQNTASAEEGAAASEELNGQAMQLRELVGRFTLRSIDVSEIKQIPYR
ncbi:MAG: methyl-accepting chemotaxis protein [Desulfuromonadaceae bacterium]